MQKQKRLMYGMMVLFLIVFVTFGVIIINEKIAPLKINKVTEKLNNYLKENYNDLKNIELTKIEYKKLRYEAKVISKENKNHYFYIYYENKKISDTYKEDYLEGNNIIKYQENNIKNNIKNKTKSLYKININKKLNKFTDNIQKEIINNKNLEAVEIYNLEANITVKELTSKRISTTIKNFINNMYDKKIKPKSYTFVIQASNNKVKALKISNITYDLVNSSNLNIVINDIINNEKTNLINKYDIKYEYLN